jgi:glutamate-1-semialdehyde 2,1-aminomutase
MSNMTLTTDEAVVCARKRYVERNPTSRTLHEEAVNYLPGGNSRSVLHTAPFPISMASGQSCNLIDDDGHEYVYSLPFGGHALMFDI